MDTFGQLLAASGMTSVGDTPIKAEPIPFDAEVARVLSLGRRAPMTEELRLALSTHCRTRAVDDHGRPNELFEGQAEAIRQAMMMRGGFFPMPVGAGKTLPTLLLPWLLQAQRPVLMLPANLRNKTKRDFAAYRRNWHVRMPTLISYQEMGRPDRAGKLEAEQPDLLMLDEAQWARNLDSAVARRVERYVAKNNPILISLSGTLITDELLDSHALCVWALGLNAPVPLPRADAERWSTAMKNRGLADIGKGALDQIPGGVYEWMRGSNGVVAIAGGECTASLEIERWKPELPEKLRDMVTAVAASAMRPDGELLDEWELPDVLCQLVQGFYYVWDPMPPEWWRAPRKRWRMYTRSVLDERLPDFDSESQIVSALDHFHDAPYANEGREFLRAWREVRDSFRPNPVPVWIDPTVLKQAAEIAMQEPTILWTRHRAAGWGLEQLGVPYYGGATNPEGADPRRSMACSIKAHGEGKNLQAWSRGLVLTPPANCDAWEQLIGREHRRGQGADVVSWRIIDAIDYHADVMDRVINEAERTQRNSGFAHKLCLATWV